MQSWGLNVLIAPHLYSKAHHFAGSDEERTADMQWALGPSQRRKPFGAREAVTVLLEL